MKLNKRARATLAMVGVTAIAGLSAGCGSDDVEQAADDVREEAEQAADDVREEAEQAADDIRDEAEELENDISGDDDGGEESTTSTQSGY